LLINRWLGWVVIGPIALMLLATAYQLDVVRRDPNASTLMVKNQELSGKRNLNDFDEFYLVGELCCGSKVLDTYDVDKLLAYQQAFTGSKSFLPWTYPPQFTAALAILPLLTIGWSFLAFTGGTMVFYLLIVRRAGWEYGGAAMLAIFPALILNARLGQNGFLTAGLIGLVLESLRRRGTTGGIPLGLLAIKPHLGLGLALMTVLERRLGTIVIAAITVVVTCGLATLILGTEVWPAWFAGVKQSSGFLNDGLYALYRLSSVYALFRSFGASSSLAFACHAVVAFAAVGILVLAYFRKWPINRLLAFTAVVNLLISPYNHDYDYASVTFAIMLILPELLRRITLWELGAFYLLTWVGTGAGLLQHLRAAVLYGTLEHPLGTSLAWSLEAPAILLATCLVTLVLRRPDSSASPAPALAT
jgi:hypothetical protein